MSYFGSIKNFFFGSKTSTTSLSDAAGYTKGAVTSMYHAAGDITAAGYHAGAAAAQVVTTVLLEQAAVGGLATTTGALNTAVVVTKYAGYAPVYTTALKGAAFAGATVLANPGTALVAATTAALIYSPEHVKGIATNTGHALYDTGSATLNTFAAGAKAVEAGVLATLETGAEVEYYANAHVFDRQNGKGTKSDFTANEVLIKFDDEVYNEFGDQFGEWDMLVLGDNVSN